jgi:aspartyl-tRNA(Asn)/glutamyl-tRNA(Gln) amidotransferase subunit B
MIEGRTGPWETVIGLEVHAQVVSKAKLFSGAATDFGAEPNTQVSPVDAAFPGMLPVINRHCVEQAVKTGLGLDAEIRLESVFDRKNYFYPDLPPGYQISQYQQPVVGRGKVALDMPDGTTREIGITRLHLEQDAGKSLHDQHPTLTYVDLNRAGVGLMEIVSEPDLRSAEEAGAYLRKLRSILRYLGTCDGNMEQGSLRCDCNVSVRRSGEPYGTRCEIKNLNSVRYVMQAIEYEARRQIEVLEEGGRIEQQTRLFDSRRGVTRPMRSKEEAHDYRYFPDPDLLPLVLDPEWVERIRAELPELPDAKRARFMLEYKLSPDLADVMTGERAIADYLDAAHVDGRDMKGVAEWISTELFNLLSSKGLSIENSPISAQQTGILIDLIRADTITRANAKALYAEMFEFNSTPGVQPPPIDALQPNLPDLRRRRPVLPQHASTLDFEQMVEAKGLRQVNDSGAIEAAIDAVLAAQADKVAEYRAGRDKLYGFFVGQIMRATHGKANPALVNELLRKKLSG